MTPRYNSLPRVIALAATEGGYIGLFNAESGQQVASSRILTGAIDTLRSLRYVKQASTNYTRPRTAPKV